MESNEEVVNFMEAYDVDEDIAEHAIELRDDLGIDDEEAIELAEEE